MFKVLLYSFSMCRHKLYQILSITKNVPCFVLLILVTLKFYTIQDKTAKVLKFLKVSLGQGTQYKTC